MSFHTDLDNYLADNLQALINIFSPRIIYDIVFNSEYILCKTYLKLQEINKKTTNSRLEILIPDVSNYDLLNFLKFDTLNDILDILIKLSESNQAAYDINYALYTSQTDKIDITADQYAIFREFKKLFTHTTILPLSNSTEMYTINDFNADYYYSCCTDQLEFLKKLTEYAEITNTNNLVLTLKFRKVTYFKTFKYLVKLGYNFDYLTFKSIKIFDYLYQQTDYFNNKPIYLILPRITKIDCFKHVIANYITDLNQVLNYYTINDFLHLLRKPLCRLISDDKLIENLKYFVELGFDIKLLKIDFIKHNISGNVIKYLIDFDLSAEILELICVYLTVKKIDLKLVYDKIEKLDLSDPWMKAGSISDLHFQQILAKVEKVENIFNLLYDESMLTINQLTYLYNNYDTVILKNQFKKYFTLKYNTLPGPTDEFILYQNFAQKYNLWTE